MLVGHVKKKKKNQTHQKENHCVYNIAFTIFQLTELGVALICWKWVTNSALLENWAWHSGHLKL